MTAIAGIISFRHDLPLEDICTSALAAQSAYGGSQTAVRRVDEAALGIDLRALLPEDHFDRQPLWNDRYMLVADVRLDNRADIVAQLGLPLSQFVERSDAEILLLAWQCWDADCMQRIVGDFALAIYDRHRRQLTLARDIAGERPLCYRVDPEGLRFASMPSGVAAHGRLNTDLAALSIQLANRLPRGRTCFEDIDAVPPGELVRFSAAGMTRARHWDPQQHYDRGSTAEQSSVELQDRLDGAVRARMRHRSAALATHLSSGYDSSAVAGTAAKFLKPGERMFALTSAPAPGLQQLEFRGRIPDESAIAASTAAAFGIEHVIVRDSSPLVDAMLGHARFYQQPVGNVFNQGWWAKVAQTASSMGADTMLSGAAGNFTISHGGLSVLPYWLRTGHWLHWLAEVRAAKRKNDVRWRGLLMASFDPWLSPQSISRIGTWFLGAPTERHIDFLRREVMDCSKHVSIEINGDPFQDRLAMIRSMDVGLGRKGLLAQTGVEERDPTSDRRLVEYCLWMPPEHLLADGVYRPVARAALADRVPGQVLAQRSRGYQGADWFARLRISDMNAIMEEISASRAGEILDLAKMTTAISHWARLDAGRATYVARLGRNLTNALATGLFIAEVERDPMSVGRAAKPQASVAKQVSFAT
ncbi:asparagine synthase-related protein [Sphingomonas sp. G124]|uniref:asparagine synthase (glutamine-hydrolyzing) n=1 Tax=Sphingomonas cremea TaxID=2904799 RepID=A0A9X1QLH8_9SPHN|nr:asparagine synthetase B [Sphingomonas cremea]MCF2514332.1 asparagine synthase-related protein [Sphingomonas cremea]